MSKLYFQLYNPCGLFNQITSLELAVGLSFKLNKDLVIHNVNNPPNSDYDNHRVPIYSSNYAFNNRGDLIDKHVYPSINDLLEWNNKENTVLIDDIVTKFTNEDTVINSLMNYYFSSNVFDSEDERYFAEERQRIPFKEKQNLHLKQTLGYYSRFFYQRDKELDKVLSTVRFKKEYYELAELVANSLGDFNGAHLRLTDHIKMFNTEQEHFDKGLDSLKNTKTIVVSTDQPDSSVIKNSSHEIILLDKYIIENFKKEFRELEFKEEVSFGILNNLVMHYSKDFIGTPGSTFSGYIQRNINQRIGYNWKIFGTDQYVQDGPYSWNGNDKDTRTKQWWQEWKESKLSI